MLPAREEQGRHKGEDRGGAAGLGWAHRKQAGSLQDSKVQVGQEAWSMGQTFRASVAWGLGSGGDIGKPGMGST